MRKMPTNRENFINDLRYYLGELPAEEREEIIRDQEEYINEAVASGRDEDEVIMTLGEPRAFAKRILIETRLVRAENSPRPQNQLKYLLGALVAILALAPLNLILVLGPFLVVLSLIVGGWSVAVSVLFSAVIFIGVFFFKMIFISVGLWTHLATFFFVMGLIGLGVLSIIVMAWLTSIFFQGVVAYLRWNLNFIRARS